MPSPGDCLGVDAGAHNESSNQLVWLEQALEQELELELEQELEQERENTMKIWEGKKDDGKRYTVKTKLHPCAACGAMALNVFDDKIEKHRIECAACGMFSPWKDSSLEAARDWNYVCKPEVKK